MTANSNLTNELLATAYDANGNLVSVMAGMFGVASFTWDAENRLTQASKNGVTETYAYDVDGNRIKKVSGGTTTRTWFPVYEEQEGGTTIKYYVFNGMRVAVKRGSSLYYLHGDHLNSTSLTTNTGGGQTASRAYYAYGSTRSSSGALQTDHTFTGQKSDGTGLTGRGALRPYRPRLGDIPEPGHGGGERGERHRINSTPGTGNPVETGCENASCGHCNVGTRGYRDAKKGIALRLRAVASLR